MAKRRQAASQQRGQQGGPPQQRGPKRSKKNGKQDVYEALDSDPEEDKHADRYDVSF